MPTLPRQPLPSGTKVLRHGPDEVEYQLLTAAGFRIVRVFLNTSEPRLSFYAEDQSGLSPMILSLSEILTYAQDAVERVEAGN